MSAVLNRVEDGFVPPRFGSRRHPRRPTLGPLLGEVATGLGFELHVWQRLVGDVSLELVARRGPGSRRRLAAGAVGCISGRQTGKTLLSAARSTLQCLLPSLPAAAELVGIRNIRPQKVAYLAQNRSAALARWREHVDVLMASDLSHHVERVVLQRGDEAIRFRNGSTYTIVTPSRTAARGMAADLLIIDEAMAHDVELLAVVSPTMAQRNTAVGSIGSQLVVVSSAGDHRSTLLAAQRELGRRAVAEGDTGRCWFEWSCADDADVLDEDVWLATIPTLGQRDGIGLEYLRLEAESLGPERFALEYLCRTTTRDPAAVIDPAAWATLPHVELTPEVDCVVAVDAAFDRTSASVVAVGQVDDVIAVELVEQRAGTDWLGPYLLDLLARWPTGVVVDRYGPVGSVAALLEREALDVTAVGVRQVVEAAQLFTDAVAAGRVGHVHDYRFTDAVAAVGRRKVGDRWAFSRHGTTDISPVVAASLGLWAVETRPRAVPMIHVYRDNERPS